MFTGLVEAVGTVLSLDMDGEQGRLSLDCPFAQELELGESVAVNGCCLTVAGSDQSSVGFDLLAQTLTVTSLGNLAPGAQVNLERALRADGRLGGHFVQGHVDNTGDILDYSPHGNDHRLEVSLPPDIHRYCLPKGSLTIDGISLTIAELKGSSAVFWITPHTAGATHLSTAAPGQKMNLEADLLAKYIEKLVPPR